MKLCFPEKVLDQHLIVLGKTGAGKSSALRLIVEHLLSHKKRVCVIDIKGDWWGLKSSADGKSAGFPVIAFGSFREPKAADVPINRHSGKHIAELITSGNRPCIIGFRGWMPSEITEFWIGNEPSWNGFAPTLFNSNEGELYVVISECHNFAPKGKVLDPKAGRVLHWTNRLLSEGRGLGMTFLLDSQRPQKVHNDTLTCCETLVAMRVTHAADREALKDWIDGCGDKATGAEVLSEVAGLAKGEAWVWSPEIGFGPKRLQFPMFETFDSFAPAQLQKKVSDSGWSAVDLDAVKLKLAAVIEEAKENDPKELKARIRELEQAAKAVKPAVDEQAVQRAVQQAVEQRDREHREDTNKLRTLLAQNVGTMRAISETAAKAATVEFPVIDRMRLPPAVMAKAAQVKSSPAPVQRRPTGGSIGDIQLRPGACRMLAACAQWRKPISEAQVAAQAGVKRTGGSFSSYKSNLVTAGLISVNGGLWSATAEGVAYIGSNGTQSPQSTEEVLAIWKPKFRPGAARMLDVLISYGGEPVAVETLAEQSGVSAEGGSFSSYLSNLATADLIVKPQRGMVAANREALFL